MRQQGCFRTYHQAFTAPLFSACRRYGPRCVARSCSAFLQEDGWTYTCTQSADSSAWSVSAASPATRYRSRAFASASVGMPARTAALGSGVPARTARTAFSMRSGEGESVIGRVRFRRAGGRRPSRWQTPRLGRWRAGRGRCRRCRRGIRPEGPGSSRARGRAGRAGAR